MRRFYTISWIAFTACAAVWINAFGFAGESIQWLSLNTWIAILYGVILAAIVTAIPAGLLSTVLWAFGIKRLKKQPNESANP